MSTLYAFEFGNAPVERLWVDDDGSVTYQRGGFPRTTMSRFQTAQLLRGWRAYARRRPEHGRLARAQG